MMIAASAAQGENMTTSANDELPPAPGQLLLDLANHLYEAGPIIGRPKARLVAESVMVLIMKYYVKEAEGNGEGGSG